jgi:Ricin-type beta-trefoil lectin domain/Ricin-type beta-trefoil lectin domain-like
MRSRFRLVGILAALMVCLIAPARSWATEPLHYYGGEIASTPHVYLTFWGKNWSGYSTARTEVLGMFSNLSSSAWQGILTQYYGHKGFVSSQVAVSSWTDESVAVPHNVTRAALEQKIQYAEGQQGWPGAGINNIYIVLPVPGSTYELNSGLGCGSHYFPAALGAPWAVVGLPIYFEGESLPANCLSADPSGQKQVGRALSAIASHEYAEAVTDPEVSGGSHGTGWARPSSGEPEIADVCATAPGGQLSNGSWVAALWDNYQNRCSTSDPAPQVATQTEVETVPLNGNPGWVTVKGHVFSGAAVNGKYVNINMKKWENNQWVLKATLQAAVNNSFYELRDWNGVGTGEWIAKVVFPTQAPFSESSSNEGTEGHFTIQDGYQIVNKPLGDKCLDIAFESPNNAAQAWLWECHSPVTNGQTFTLVPVETNNYADHFQIVARNSDKCVDVRNDNQVAGEQLQQWACANPIPSVQVWKRFGSENGSNGWGFEIQHSHQCMDDWESGWGNGTKIDQWPCNGTGAQGWKLKSVNAPQVTTHVSLNQPEVLHGEPGLVTFGGQLDLSGYPTEGATVNVNLDKAINGAWVFQKEESLQLHTNGSGHYEIDYYGVGVGEWRARAVFLGNQTLGESASAQNGNDAQYVHFTVHRGYHLVNQTSNKCLSVSEGRGDNGAPVMLWDCSGNPQAGDGQLFTWYPMVNHWPYHQIRFNEPGGNNAGNCLDVTGVSKNDGVQLQLWQCLGESQDNQLWEGRGGGEYQEFLAKHSGKCIDDWFSGTNNGNKIDQYTCNGTGAQKWKFVPVG